ncbi:DMAC1 protein, partial [Alcedo cyanopectus]|nr:DMAC1 protein [Ceyx cyanopectus]
STSAAAMTAAPGPVAAPVQAPEKPRPLFGGCWSCRILSGTGLLLAALWIYSGPRRIMKRGIAPNMAQIAQITFAISERRRGNGGGGAWEVMLMRGAGGLIVVATGGLMGGSAV